MTFIALEGGEGVGKSTQMRLLRERLPDLFPERDFVFTREPGGSEFAESIRTVILSDSAKKADGKTMFALFSAARFDHVANLIRPSLQAGKTVLSDRYFGSSYAYQVCAQENPISEQFFDACVEELAMFPTVTIVLDMDPVRSQERLKRRSDHQSNHFDERALVFHQKLHAGYNQFITKYGRRGVYRINADQEPEMVFRDIMTVLDPILSR